MREIELQIDELVIEGASHGDGIRAGDAFSRELVRLLERSPTPSMFAREQAIARLDAGVCTSAASTSSSVIGVAVAQAIHRGFGR
jgi:hypothetical protein